MQLLSEDCIVRQLGILELKTKSSGFRRAVDDWFRHKETEESELQSSARWTPVDPGGPVVVVVVVVVMRPGVMHR